MRDLKLAVSRQAGFLVEADHVSCRVENAAMAAPPLTTRPANLTGNPTGSRPGFPVHQALFRRVSLFQRWMRAHKKS